MIMVVVRVWMHYFILHCIINHRTCYQKPEMNPCFWLLWNIIKLKLMSWVVFLWFKINILGKSLKILLPSERNENNPFYFKFSWNYLGLLVRVALCVWLMNYEKEILLTLTHVMIKITKSYFDLIIVLWMNKYDLTSHHQYFL